MIDFHSHVLPGIDDGSHSPEESAEMLRMLAHQGVDKLALTSHFYANENSPQRFLERRAAAFERLQTVLTDEMPRVYLGAEVYYFRGISHMEGLEDLRLENSCVLLLEMPFDTWPEAAVREVEDLCRDGRFVVMMAHIERYLKYQKRDVWDRLLSEGAVVQVNASFFRPGFHQGKAIRMAKEGRIHVLGTDCHNLSSRRPNMDEALEQLDKRLGPAWTDRFLDRMEDAWEDWQIS